MSDKLGPCKVCGATNYGLSFGGPDICPSCDAGTTSPWRLNQRITVLESALEAKDARIAELESHSWFVRLSSDNADLRGHIAHDSERRKMLADEFDLYDVLPESDAGYDAAIKRIIAYLREGEQ